MLIGPTFVYELRAANVPLDGVAWGEDGAFCFREDVPPAVRAAVAAVFAKHDPTKVPQIQRRVTDGELAGLLVTKNVLTATDLDRLLNP